MNENLLVVVYKAIDEVNAQLDGGKSIAKTPDTRLLGGKDALDSLTFVNVIVAVEEQIRQDLGKTVTLVDEGSMAGKDRPFRSVGSLVDYIEKILEE